MVTEISISKGSYNVTIYATEVNDNLDNKLFNISPPTGKSNQDSGPKDTKIVDILRITRQINITQGAITGTSLLTAKQVKDQLITMFKGAGEKGGVCTMTYDGDSHTGVIEKLTFIQTASDEPDSPEEDYAKYRLQMNFIVGTTI